MKFSGQHFVLIIAPTRGIRKQTLFFLFAFLIQINRALSRPVTWPSLKLRYTGGEKMHHSLTTTDPRNNSIAKIIAEEKLTLFLWCYQVSSLFCALAVGSGVVFISYAGTVFTLVKTDSIVCFVPLLCQEVREVDVFAFFPQGLFPPQVATAFSVSLRWQNPTHKMWMIDPVLPQTECLAACSQPEPRSLHNSSL